MPSPYDLTREELAELLADQPAYRLRQVWDGLYRQGTPFTELTTLPRALRERLHRAAPPALRPAAQRTADDGDTVKWLWELHDGARIETVLMHYPDRSTVCVSTQAGCAMGCGFCATGQAGYERNLSVGEIVEQVVVPPATRPRPPAVGCPTSCSWAWASRSPTTTARVLGRPSGSERRPGHRGPTPHHLDRRPRAPDPPSRRGGPPGQPGRLAARRQRRAPRRAGAHQPSPPARRTGGVHAELFRERTGRRVSFEWAMIDGVNDRPLRRRGARRTVARSAPTPT
jgi:23S rRNA (adenine2503-C2)-methyltransferase